MLSLSRLYMIAAFMFLIVCLTSTLTFSLAVFIMQFFLSTITICLLAKKDYKLVKLYMIIFVVSFVFVFLVYVANISYYGSPYYIGGSDDLHFEKEGSIIADSGVYSPSKLIQFGILRKDHNTPFFSLLIAILIKFSEIFGGYSTFLPRIMNVYFLLWACMVIEYLLRKYVNFSDKKVYVSIAIFALMPNIQYINSHVFRDTFNLLQMLLIILLFDKVFDKEKIIKRIIYIGLLALLLYITYYTRNVSIFFSVVICMLILVNRIRIKSKHILVLLLLLGTPIILFSNLSNIINYYIGTYTNYVLRIAKDGFSRYIFMQPLLPLGIILRALYALITPFPDFFRLFREPARLLYDFVMFFIYIGVIIQILGIPFILKRIFRIDWLSMSFTIWFLAVIATTFTFRHVIFYYPFLVAVGIDGYLTTRKKTRIYILFMSLFTGCALSIIYLLLKHF